MADMRRVPPHNKEAEQAVIASILLDDKALDKVVDKIQADDFYIPAHQNLFRKILWLQEQGKPVDVVTVIGSLSDEDLQRAGGVEYISSLVDIIPTSANVGHYADIVRDRATLRQLIGVAVEITEFSYEQPENVSEVVENAEKRIFSLAEHKLKSSVQPLSKLMHETLDMLNSLFHRSDQLSGVNTGFKDLNNVTNGLQNSDLIIVAGRPGMGKTAFSLNVALNAAYMDNRSVVFFSLEMSSHQLAQRLLAAQAGVESNKLRGGKFTMEEWQKLASAAGVLGDMKLFIDDTPAITPLELRAKCRRIKREHGLDLIFVDYLQLMGATKGDNREQQISEISRSLKALAKELNIPVIALSQLNRGVEQRADKRPMISDLRESGAIEQDADMIIFLYRDEVYNKQSDRMGIAEVIIAKHRNGPVTEVELSFIKEYMLFKDLYRG
ncbi:replicative DNA helicase [Seleniivibrio woodruffii]|uniref:replicative DNA helicase n=1 Tax=Seleniivibrio woodruffii TaxID=1078050 RepID=UPI0026EB8248|nr:replicative DNA helicase [Seleniivibrio woodruffii]